VVRICKFSPNGKNINNDFFWARVSGRSIIYYYFKDNFYLMSAKKQKIGSLTITKAFNILDSDRVRIV
jgi:hypothetical protein